jgi:hypothetical protein
VVKEIPKDKTEASAANDIAIQERETEAASVSAGPVQEENLVQAETHAVEQEPAAAVPSRDMQKLMNTAGQSLRAQ